MYLMKKIRRELDFSVPQPAKQIPSLLRAEKSIPDAVLQRRLVIPLKIHRYLRYLSEGPHQQPETTRLALLGRPQQVRFMSANMLSVSPSARDPILRHIGRQASSGARKWRKRDVGNWLTSANLRGAQSRQLSKALETWQSKAAIAVFDP